MHTSNFISIPEAAKRCGVGRSTLWRWVKSGQIKAFITPGGHHRIAEEELQRFIDNGCTAAGKPLKRILIVDDDAKICSFIQKQLKKRDYQTDVAENGFDAGIKVIETKPDLVMLDLLMPGLDGIEVCKRIKQNKMLSGTKIIILTGMDTAQNRQKSVDAGADAFQSKNDSPKKIFNLIEQMLR